MKDKIKFTNTHKTCKKKKYFTGVAQTSMLIIKYFTLYITIELNTIHWMHRNVKYIYKYNIKNK